MSPVETSRYHCIFCTFVATDASKLRKHFEREHGRNSFFWCKWCGKAFSCLDELIDHLEKNLCNGTYEHPCGFEGCDYSDPEPARFIAHLKSFHKGKPLIPCKYCKRLFTLPPCLVTHLQDSCCNRPQAKDLPRTLPQSKTINVNAGNSSSSESKFSSNPSANKKSLCQTVSNTTLSNSIQSEPSSNKSANKKSSRAKETKKPSKQPKKTKNTPRKPQVNDLSESDVDDPTWNPIVEGNDSGKLDKSRKSYSRSVASQETSSNDKRKLNELDIQQKPSKKKKNDEEGKVECVQINSWEEWKQRVHLLKSDEAYKELLKLENIKNFYKCMHKSCTFSSSDKMNFALHVLNTNHSDQLHRCCYCLSDFSYIEQFMKHMVSEHGNRKWQCSACLYRSCSKGHVIFHQQTAHSEDEKATILHCKLMEMEGFKRSSVPTSNTIAERNSYSCFVPNCDFSTFITEHFEIHLKEEHSKIKIFKCCYCKSSTTTLEKFLSHFRAHDIYEFECSCCSFGADKSDDVLRHICINHADFKVPVLCRKSKQEEPSPKLKKSKNSKSKKNDSESVQADDPSAEPKNEKPGPRCTKSSNLQSKKSDSELVKSQVGDQQIESTKETSKKKDDDTDKNDTMDDNKPAEDNTDDDANMETENACSSQPSIASQSDEISGYSSYGQRLNKLNLKEVYITTREGVKIFSSDFRILIPLNAKMVVQDVRRFY